MDIIDLKKQFLDCFHHQPSPYDFSKNSRKLLWQAGHSKSYTEHYRPDEEQEEITKLYRQMTYYKENIPEKKYKLIEDILALSLDIYYILKPLETIRANFSLQLIGEAIHTILSSDDVPQELDMGLFFHYNNKEKNKILFHTLNNTSRMKKFGLDITQKDHWILHGKNNTYKRKCLFTFDTTTRLAHVVESLLKPHYDLETKLPTFGVEQIPLNPNDKKYYQNKIVCSEFKPLSAMLIDKSFGYFTFKVRGFTINLNIQNTESIYQDYFPLLSGCVSLANTKHNIESFFPQNPKDFFNRLSISSSYFQGLINKKFKINFSYYKTDLFHNIFKWDMPYLEIKYSTILFDFDCEMPREIWFSKQIQDKKAIILAYKLKKELPKKNNTNHIAKTVKI